MSHQVLFHLKAALSCLRASLAWITAIDTLPVQLNATDAAFLGTNTAFPRLITNARTRARAAASSNRSARSGLPRQRCSNSCMEPGSRLGSTCDCSACRRVASIGEKCPRSMTRAASGPPMTTSHPLPKSALSNRSNHRAASPPSPALRTHPNDRRERTAELR